MRVLLVLGLLSTTLAHRGTAQRWQPEPVTFATIRTPVIHFHWSMTAWAPEHVALAMMSSSLILADWSTTADAVRRCGGGKWICTPAVEQNPLIGSSPSVNTIRAWSLVALTGSLAGGTLIRRRWMRTVWFAGVTMIELMVVQHNMRAGLRLSVRL